MAQDLERVICFVLSVGMPLAFKGCSILAMKSLSKAQHGGAGRMFFPVTYANYDLAM